MNEVVRRNLRLRVGESCTVLAIKERVASLSSVNIVPYSDCLNDKEKTKRTYTDAFLAPYFRNLYRPVRKNDQISIKRGERTLDFIVEDVQPGEYGIVGPTT